MTIALALRRFLTQLAADGRSPHTIAQYRRHVQLFADWLTRAKEESRVHRVSHEAVAEFFGSRTGRLTTTGHRRKETSANAIRSSLRVFFDYVKTAGYSKVNAAALLRRALCGPPLPRALSPVAIRRLLQVLDRTTDAVDRRDRILVLLLLRTGLRISEALGLDVNDVDLRRGEIRLRRTKGNRSAAVPIERSLRTELYDWIGDRDREPLFHGRKGSRLTVRQVQRRFHHWATQAKLRRLAPHQLRHSLATQVYEATGDVRLVQSILRHRNIASTIVYAHASPARIRRALGA